MRTKCAFSFNNIRKKIFKEKRGNIRNPKSTQVEQSISITLLLLLSNFIVTLVFFLLQQIIRKNNDEMHPLNRPMTYGCHYIDL